MKLIGVGEGLEDLRPFDAREFAAALFAESGRAARKLDAPCSTSSPTAFRRRSRGVRSRGKLTEADVDTAMREIRLALLEADVNFKVVKQFTSQVRERCLGAGVLESLNPGQQVVKIVNEELAELMGGASRDLAFARARARR